MKEWFWEKNEDFNICKKKIKITFTRTNDLRKNKINEVLKVDYLYMKQLTKYYEMKNDIIDYTGHVIKRSVETSF